MQGPRGCAAAHQRYQRLAGRVKVNPGVQGNRFLYRWSKGRTPPGPDNRGGAIYRLGRNHGRPKGRPGRKTATHTGNAKPSPRETHTRETSPRKTHTRTTHARKNPPTENTHGKGESTNKNTRPQGDGNTPPEGKREKGKTGRRRGPTARPAERLAQPDPKGKPKGKPYTSCNDQRTVVGQRNSWSLHVSFAHHDVVCDS